MHDDAYPPDWPRVTCVDTSAYACCRSWGGGGIDLGFREVLARLRVAAAIDRGCGTRGVSFARPTSFIFFGYPPNLAGRIDFTFTMGIDRVSRVLLPIDYRAKIDIAVYKK